MTKPKRKRKQKRKARKLYVGCVMNKPHSKLTPEDISHLKQCGDPKLIDALLNGDWDVEAIKVREVVGK